MAQTASSGLFGCFQIHAEVGGFAAHGFTGGMVGGGKQLVNAAQIGWLERGGSGQAKGAFGAFGGL